MMDPSSRLERRLIALAAALLGVFNVVLAMFPAPLSGFGQFEDIVPMEALNGSRFVLVILGAMLIASSYGLLHGKRASWGIALGCAVGSVLAHPFKNVDIWGTFASLGLAGVLLAARRQFPARSDVPTALRGARFLGFGLMGVFWYSTLGLYLMDRQFKSPVPMVDALEDSLRLMFILPATAAEPATQHGNWFLESVRVSFLFVVVVGVWMLLQPVIYRTRTAPHERERVRELLERFATSSLAFFALLPDKRYFFSDDGDAVVAYKSVGGNAIVMGDPLGNPRQFPGVLDTFRQHCDLNGWTCTFHQASGERLDLYRREGMKAIRIGEEGIVDLAEFTLSGTRMKHLRATMNRFKREGYRCEVLAPPHSPELLHALRGISDRWLCEGNRRERTFTLGQFNEGLLQQCRILVARAADGAVAGFANIIPPYRSTDGNFDMVRYGDEPKALSDFLYVSLIEHFRAQGFEGMTLGLSPFSGVATRDDRSPAARAMQLLYRRGGVLFRYEGLRQYKEKFGPRWEPRFLVYSGDLQLPGVALAVARAGEIDMRAPASQPRDGGVEPAT